MVAQSAEVRPTSSACFVICEGRTIDAVGVKLLLASLQQHAPDFDVLAYISRPLLDACRADFSALHQRLHLIEYHGPENWSCKPVVLLDAIDRFPGKRMVWVDVDILVAGKLSVLAAVGHDMLIIAQESNPNDNARVMMRQRALEIPVGSPRETTISSCVIGVTEAHRPLLVRWQSLMRHESFLREQALVPENRKLFMGDQEVWEAVLCEPAHRDIPAFWLINDTHLVQANFSTYRSSIPATSRDGPLFIHATGNLKPWRKSRERLLQEMFPYFWHARAYRALLSPSEQKYFRRKSPFAWLWQHVGGGFSTYRSVRRLLRRFQ